MRHPDPVGDAGRKPAEGAESQVRPEAAGRHAPAAHRGEVCDQPAGSASGARREKFVHVLMPALRRVLRSKAAPSGFWGHRRRCARRGSVWRGIGGCASRRFSSGRGRRRRTQRTLFLGRHRRGWRRGRPVLLLSRPQGRPPCSAPCLWRAEALPQSHGVREVDVQKPAASLAAWRPVVPRPQPRLARMASGRQAVQSLSSHAMACCRVPAPTAAILSAGLHSFLRKDASSQSIMPRFRPASQQLKMSG